MKTPREILLARHRAVEQKLDDIRQDVVGELNNKASKTQSLPSSLVSRLVSCPNAIWRELIWPARRVWAGLAVVWLLILAVNVSMRDHSEIKVAKSTPSPEVIMAFRQQQQLLNELIGPDDPPVAEAPKTYSPRPASERRREPLIS
jgi:hypothetical protein